MIHMILFDLDGTLLPMDQEVFTRAYFRRLAEKLAPRGYDPEQLVKGIWEGTEAMVRNDGSRINEKAFWDCFSRRFGERVLADKPVFEAFYREDFPSLAQVCGHNSQAAETVRSLRQQGFRLALATNPIFPAVATESRIRWTGLEPEEFELITTYENTSFCKPNPSYYRDILLRLGCRGEECLMVGNDAQEDLAAREAGIEVFLLTDCLINKTNRPLAGCPQGGFADLRRYISERAEERKQP